MSDQCLIRNELERATAAGKEFARQLQIVQKEFDKCDQCKDKDNCTIRDDFDASINEIIREITDEWKITHV